MNMIVSSQDLLAGAAVVAYQKVIEQKKNMNIKEGAWIVAVSALARAWNNSQWAMLDMPSSQRKLIYAAALNVLRDLVIDKEDVDFESVAKKSIEAAAAVAVGDWLKAILQLSW
jgi:hypothetical protein